MARTPAVRQQWCIHQNDWKEPKHAQARTLSTEWHARTRCGATCTTDAHKGSALNNGSIPPTAPHALLPTPSGMRDDAAASRMSCQSGLGSMDTLPQHREKTKITTWFSSDGAVVRLRPIALRLQLLACQTTLRGTPALYP